MKRLNRALKRIWSCCMVAFCLAFWFVPAAPAQGSPYTPSDTIVIARFNDSADELAFKALLEGLGASVCWRSEFVSELVAVHCPLHNAPTVMAMLANLPSLKYAELGQNGTPPEYAIVEPCGVGLPNPECEPTGTSDFSTLQWAIENHGQAIGDVAGTPGADMRVKAAWTVTVGSPNILIGITEASGVDIEHDEFNGTLWTNPADSLNGIDDDHNGIIDDVHGFFVFTDEFTGEMTFNGDPSPERQDGEACQFIRNDHGTMCAGLISARYDGHGVTGIAPGCRLIAVRYLRNPTFDEILLNLIFSLEYFLKHEARVSSWSHGVPASAAFEDLVAAAAEKNHTLVVAAGNETINLELPDPGQNWWLQHLARNHKNVITVAALDSHDCLATFYPSGSSNYGVNTVLCAAPGWRQLSVRRKCPGTENHYYTNSA